MTADTPRVSDEDRNRVLVEVAEAAKALIDQPMSVGYWNILDPAFNKAHRHLVATLAALDQARRK